MKRLPGSIPRTRNAPPPGTGQVFSVVPQGIRAVDSGALVHPREADVVVRAARAGGIGDELVGGRDAVVGLDPLPGVVEVAVRVVPGGAAVAGADGHLP